MQFVPPSRYFLVGFGGKMQFYLFLCLAEKFAKNDVKMETMPYKKMFSRVLFVQAL